MEGPVAGTSSRSTFVKKYHIVVVGDKGVGKSSLTERAMRSEADSTEKLRIIGDNVVNIEFTDLPSAAPAMEESLIKRADGFLILFSIWDRDSFQNVPFYVKNIRKIRQKKKVPIMLVGNKIDLSPVNTRPVQPWEAISLSGRFGIGYQECSVLTGQNLEELIQELGQSIWDAQMGSTDRDEDEFLESHASPRRRRKKCTVL